MLCLRPAWVSFGLMMVWICCATRAAAQHTGIVHLTDSTHAPVGLVYPPSTTRVFANVFDLDRASSSSPSDTLEVIFSTPSDPGESVALAGMGVGSGQFIGSIDLDVRAGPGPIDATPDGQLQVRRGQTLLVVYHDPNDDFGNASTAGDDAIFNGIQGGASGEWSRAQSPYIVVGNVGIGEGATLQIDAGVEVRFLPGASLTVGGGLRVAGAAGDSVRFTSNRLNPFPGDWGPIFIYFGGGSGHGNLSHVIIEYGRGLVYEGSASIDHSVIRWNRDQGVSAFGTTPISLDRSVIEHNGGFGLSLTGGRLFACTIRDNVLGGLSVDGSVSVDSSAILGNQGPGVSCVGSLGTISITHSRISDNHGVGVSINSASRQDVVLNGNDLEDNAAYEIRNESSGEINARDNFWGAATTAEMNAGGNPKNIGRIYDRYDDGTKGFVNYSAWRNATAVTQVSWGRVKALFR